MVKRVAGALAAVALSVTVIGGAAVAVTGDAQASAHHWCWA